MEFSNFHLNGFFEEYQPPPYVGHFVVGIEDVRDGNLRFAVRYFLSNVEKSISLFIVKREWSDQDEKYVDDLVKTEYRRSHDLNQSAIDRVNKLPDSEWKSDRLDQLNQWRTIPAINYTFLILNDNLKSQIESQARITPRTAIIQDSDENSDEAGAGGDQQLSNKPPVLHWTIDPLEGEIQFIVQFHFSLAGPDDVTFRDICRSLKPHVESAYEWTDGILLTSDPVRLHVQRYSDTVIEYAARICVDELEGDEADKPMRFVWPYLAVALKQTIQSLDEHPHIQYSISFVPYGSIFFSSPSIEARVFDSTVFCATALKYQKVGFKIGEIVHHVDLEQIFPDGIYPSIGRLLTMQPPSPKFSRPESVAENLPAPPPISSDSTPGGLSVSHNRGRRVSFGTIKLMSDAPATTPEIPILQENGTGTDKKETTVGGFIDNMVQQAMDQLAV
ncbi:unnamed protein product [Caenorhabditis angaria]|uniref:Uncharacterized protein n=1 Tax=Caenorhabditis angaria TaxID=860376 RepID=A0A9P1IT67_9PELO|nr:unnamed protein product [Caenorhabditis angaria]